MIGQNKNCDFIGYNQVYKVKISIVPACNGPERQNGEKNLNGLDLRSREANKSFDFFPQMMFF